jgi:DNA-binding NarL/FixJ family response regulator
MTISVLLADDQPMVRGGLRLILEDQPDIEVVAEASDGAEAVALARRLRPDVCLVDIRMPRLDGIEVTRTLAGPDVADPLRVIVVTTFDVDEYVYGALRGGAVGFILKDAGPALLVEAVRAAHAGDALVSPSVTVRLLRHLTTSAAGAPGLPGRFGWSAVRPKEPGGFGEKDRPNRPGGGSAARPLSERESEVVRAIARGRTNLEIGAEMFISLSTVKGHVAAVQAKLGLRNRVEIAAWAWENRLIGH